MSANMCGPERTSPLLEAAASLINMKMEEKVG